MQQIIFTHLYELDNILFELPFNFRIWQIIEMLSQTELDAWVCSVTVA